MTHLVKNHGLNASQALVEKALSLGIVASVLEKTRPAKRRYGANGSTHSPQKAVLFNGIRMSLGQARQYVAARS